MNEIKAFFADGQTPVLRGKRIYLAEIEGFSDPQDIYLSLFDGVFAADLNQANEMLEKVRMEFNNGEAIHWGIFLNETSKLIGTCGYHHSFSEPSGEIGYILKPQFTGLGIMTEAVKLIIDFGFDKLALECVMAYVNPTNEASMAVLGRLNFEKVDDLGEDIKFVYPRGRWLQNKS